MPAPTWGDVRQELSLQFYDVRDYGAVGDGATDDRAAIQSAIDAADGDGGGIVRIPAGVFVVGRAASSAWCLDLGGTSNVTIAGVGIGVTTLRQAGSMANDVRLISFSSTADHTTIRNLTLDGNSANQSVNEQRHGIFVTNSTDVLVRDVQSKNFTGDGFYVYSGSYRVSFEQCAGEDNDRNGLTLGGTAGDVKILGCWFRGNAKQAVDSEPTSSDHIDNVAIEGCTLESTTNYALTCGGSSASNRNVGWRVAGNKILSESNAIRAIYNEGIVFVGNTVVSGSGAYAAVEIYADCRKVAVVGNDIVSPNSGEHGGVSIVATASGYADSVTVAANTIDISGGAVGVRAQGCGSLAITGNDIIGDGATSAAGVYVRSTYDMLSVVVVGNTIRNCATSCVQIAADVSTNRMEGVVVTGNVFIDDQETPTVLYGLRVTGTPSNIGEIHVGANSHYGVATPVAGAAPYRHGFYGIAPVPQPEITYSRTGESAAAAALRGALSTLGLLADNTTA